MCLKKITASPKYLLKIKETHFQTCKTSSPPADPPKKNTQGDNSSKRKTILNGRSKMQQGMKAKVNGLETYFRRRCNMPL